MAQVSAVRLWLLSDSAQILILVSDASPQPPVLMGVTDEAERGRGLMLVEAISEQWGWYSREAGDGKFVWAIAMLCLRVRAVPRRQRHLQNRVRGLAFLVAPARPIRFPFFRSGQPSTLLNKLGYEL